MNKSPGTTYDKKKLRRVSDFIRATYHYFAIAEGNGDELITSTAKKVLDIIDINHLLSIEYSDEDLVRSIAVQYSVLSVASDVQNSLFPNYASVHGENVLGRSKPVIINGIAYKEYRLKSRKKNEKYTVFAMLSEGRPKFGKEIKTSKRYKFTHDEILESFLYS